METITRASVGVNGLADLGFIKVKNWEDKVTGKYECRSHPFTLYCLDIFLNDPFYCGYKYFAKYWEENKGEYLSHFYGFSFDDVSELLIFLPRFAPHCFLVNQSPHLKTYIYPPL